MNNIISVVVALIIVSVAATLTGRAFVNGWKAQDYQIRYKKALSIARDESEKIQSVIYNNLDTQQPTFFSGNLRHPEVVLLDEREGKNAIYCTVGHSPITIVDDPATGVGIDYFKFYTVVEWFEPYDAVSPSVKIHAAMIRRD